MEFNILKQFQFATVLRRLVAEGVLAAWAGGASCGDIPPCVPRSQVGAVPEIRRPCLRYVYELNDLNNIFGSEVTVDFAVPLFVDGTAKIRKNPRKPSHPHIILTFISAISVNG